jgi:uncharacterized membrane protein
MTTWDKDGFLRDLARRLAELPQEQRAEMLADYEEHFRIGREKGKTDAEVAAALGTPRQIAAACLTDLRVSEAETARGAGPKLRSLLRAVAATVGLGFFNALFVAVPFIIAVSVLMAVWAVAVSPVLAGITVFAAAVKEFGLQVVASVWGLGHVFLSVGLVSFGTLAVLGVVLATRWFATVTVRYVRLNLELIAR